MTKIELEKQIPACLAGRRLDQALAELFPDYSRARLQEWVKLGQILVDERNLRPRDRVMGGERVTIHAVQEEMPSVEPQSIPLDVVFEDEALLVINKPAGLVVHPAAGNPDGTFQNALLHYSPQLAGVSRAGIVHRLDKETSGLLVVAKTLAAHNHLVRQLQERRMGREYTAIVRGVMVAGGTVDAPIGRHPVDRKRQAVVPGGKEAVSHYRVVERYREHTQLRVTLETGRTHQIRVHMAYIHHPLVGDPVYGGRLRLPKGAHERLVEELRQFSRQALHAQRLALTHPQTSASLQWEVPLAEDIQRLVTVLTDDAQRGES